MVSIMRVGPDQPDRVEASAEGTYYEDIAHAWRGRAMAKNCDNTLECLSLIHISEPTRPY